jgi:hypothetical protein
MNNKYWSCEQPWPLSPNQEDVNYYKSHLRHGTTLLLGCTHKLIPISNNQLDLDPWYQAKTVIKGNWIYNKDFYDNIIGDGVFNFTKNLTDNVLEMASKLSKVLVVRCFNKKLPTMQIADYFPQNHDFLIKPHKIKKDEDYNFYIWNFS